MVELSTLPAPQVIEALDFEAIVARQKARFASLWAVVKAEHPTLSLPDYDVVMLESDPAVILIEEESYRELLLRARINEAARANLLSYATGADLDNLAAFYDVSRMADETDARLKQRVILEIQGRSSGGPAARYKAVAMAADSRVASVSIYRDGRSPVVHVVIFSTSANGVASAELLAEVDAALQADDVRLVNDTIIVGAGVRNVVDLSADIWLLPDADEATLIRAENALRDAWAAEQDLGRDLMVSWWTARLMVSGVARLVATSPAADVVVPNSEAIAIGSVTLTLKGRIY